jgi:hypothetical protein
MKFFDFSNYPKDDHPSGLFSNTKKKVPGLMKDETGGKQMVKTAAPRPKMYSYLMDDGKEEKKAKGVKKYVIIQTETNLRRLLQLCDESGRLFLKEQDQYEQVPKSWTYNVL